MSMNDINWPLLYQELACFFSDTTKAIRSGIIEGVREAELAKREAGDSQAPTPAPRVDPGVRVEVREVIGQTRDYDFKTVRVYIVAGGKDWLVDIFGNEAAALRTALGLGLDGQVDALDEAESAAVLKAVAEERAAVVARGRRQVDKLRALGYTHAAACLQDHVNAIERGEHRKDGGA